MSCVCHSFILNYQNNILKLAQHPIQSIPLPVSAQETSARVSVATKRTYAARSCTRRSFTPPFSSPRSMGPLESGHVRSTVVVSPLRHSLEPALTTPTDCKTRYFHDHYVHSNTTKRTSYTTAVPSIIQTATHIFFEHTLCAQFSNMMALTWFVHCVRLYGLQSDGRAGHQPRTVRACTTMRTLSVITVRAPRHGMLFGHWIQSAFSKPYSSRGYGPSALDRTACWSSRTMRSRKLPAYAQPWTSGIAHMLGQAILTGIMHAICAAGNTLIRSTTNAVRNCFTMPLPCLHIHRTDTFFCDRRNHNWPSMLCCTRLSASITV
jgi:hypothetical protein